jgi:hypothetical protein
MLFNLLTVMSSIGNKQVYMLIRYDYLDLEIQRPPQCTVKGTSDYILWTLYRSYFKGISANIELSVYSETSC